MATQKVKAINYQPVITASGRLAMDESINLSFKTGGQIKQLFVKNGQTVKKGQVLAILNTNQVEIQADQASIDIDRIDIAIKSSELLLEKAKTDYENTLGLFEDSLATLEQLEQAKVNMDIYNNQLLTTQKQQQMSTKAEKRRDARSAF